MTSLRSDLAIIARNVRNGSRVLDVGCGDGQLMAALRDHKQVDARGLGDGLTPDELQGTADRIAASADHAYAAAGAIVRRFAEAADRALGR